MSSSFAELLNANHAPNDAKRRSILTFIAKQTPSSFAELLNTNHAPNDGQRRSILTFIAEQESLQAGLQLLGYGDLIRNTIRKHRTLLSPIRTVPTEIWSEIFTYCFIPAQYEIIERQPNLMEAPMLLTRICSFWRNIAISTTAIWTRLGVDTNLRHDELGSHINCLQTWIARSGQQPLSIFVHFPPKFARGRHLHLIPEEIFTLLISCSERWKSLVLIWPSEPSFFLFTDPCISMPALEYLALYLPGELDPRFAISKTATRLSEVVFNAVNLDPIHQNLAWTQLTQFESDARLSSDGFLSILCNAPALTHLSLTVVDDVEQSFSIVHPVVHAQLSYLQMNPPRTFGRLLEALTFPKLQTLKIHGKRYSDIPWPHRQFQAMLSRSSHPLEQLGLVGFCVEEQQLVEIARNARNLESLSVTHFSSDLVSSRVKRIIARRSNLEKPRDVSWVYRGIPSLCTL